MPEEFRPEDQFKSAFGMVEEAPMAVSIRFSPTIAHTINDRVWHPTQTIRQEQDGSIVLSFTAGGKMEMIAGSSPTAGMRRFWNRPACGKN